MYSGQQGYRWHRGSIGDVRGHWGCRGVFEVAGGLGADHIGPLLRVPSLPLVSLGE